jgi:hypothetical protein
MESQRRTDFKHQLGPALRASKRSLIEKQRQESQRNLLAAPVPTVAGSPSPRTYPQNSLCLLSKAFFPSEYLLPLFYFISFGR